MRSKAGHRLSVVLILALIMGGKAMPAFARGPAGDTPDLAAALSRQRSEFVLDPTSENAARLATLLQQSGNPAAALHVLEETPPETGLLEWHRRTAQLAEQAKLPLKAIPHLETLYQANPDLNTGKRLLLAMIAAHSDLLPAFAHTYATAFPTAAGSVIETALAAGRRDLAVQIAHRLMEGPSIERPVLHQVAHAFARAGLATEAWPVYARLFTGRVSGERGAELRWRLEWLDLSTAAEDVSPDGLKNLQALVSLQPARLDLRRRLVGAELEVGDHAAALHQLRLLCAMKAATHQDLVQFARCLIWYGQVDEGFKLWHKLAEAGALSPSELHEVGYQAACAERWQDAAYFFGKLAERQPGREVLDDLAKVREQLAGASANQDISTRPASPSLPVKLTP